MMTVYKDVNNATLCPRSKVKTNAHKAYGEKYVDLGNKIEIRKQTNVTHITASSLRLLFKISISAK